MAQQRRTGATIEVVEGDITAQEDIEAVVNAANAQLRPGGGVAGAIHRAAGPALDEECRRYAPIAPGEAVVTGGHDLPNKYVIHTLGPVYGRDTPGDDILANCYVNSLKIAEREGISSVAFPAISTGAFGYPLEQAASIAVESVAGMARELTSVKVIRFVLFGDDVFACFKSLVNKNEMDE